MTDTSQADIRRGRRAFLAGAGGVIAAGAGGVAAQPALAPSPADAVTPQAFGAVADGRRDDADAFERAIAAAMGARKVLFQPPGIYRIGRALAIRPSEPLIYAPRFSAGPRIVGAGSGATQFLASFGGEPLLDIASSTERVRDFSATFGAHLEGFTIRSDGGAGGIRLRSAYNATLRDLHLVGLGGNGVEIVCRAGDHDASNMVHLHQVRIELCGGWGIDAAAADGFNEISFLRLDHVFIQACGRPLGTGGGMRWKGQNCAIEQSAFALNHNVGLYVPGGPGLAQTLDLANVTFENNNGRHLLCTGISALKGRNLQFYSSGDPKLDVACEFDGRRSTIRFVDLDGVVVRAAARNAPHTAFRITGTHAELDRCRVRNVIWEDFDHPRQNRFEGFLFDHAAQCCRLQILSPTEVIFAADPDGRGNRTPLRLGGAASATGEWIEAVVQSAVLLRNSGLRPRQTYHVYLYDDRNVKRLEASTTAPTIDPISGYLVKADDASRLHVGSIETDSAGRFTNT